MRDMCIGCALYWHACMCNIFMHIVCGHTCVCVCVCFSEYNVCVCICMLCHFCVLHSCGCEYSLKLVWLDVCGCVWCVWVFGVCVCVGVCVCNSFVHSTTTLWPVFSSSPSPRYHYMTSALCSWTRKGYRLLLTFCTVSRCVSLYGSPYVVVLMW